MKYKRIIIQSTLLILAIPSLSLSQQYEFEKIGPYTGDDESAIAINDRGELIGDNHNVEGGLFYAKVDGTKIVDLSEVGFDILTDINNSGTVLGHIKENGKYSAAIWSLENGLKILPKLADFDQSQGFAINDKGDVVGVNFYSDYYAEYYGGAFCVNSRAFVWSNKAGLKKVSHKPSVASLAFDINQSGRIVYGERAQKWESYKREIREKNSIELRRECYFTTQLLNFYTKKTNSTPLILRAHQGTRYVSFYDHLFTNKLAQISNDNFVLIDDNLYKPNRQRPINNAFNGAEVKLGISGIGLGYDSLYRPNRGNVYTECLLPQNREILNSSSSIGNIERYGTSPVDFFNLDSFVFNANISGDAKYRQIFIARKLAKKDFGLHYNHCIAIENISIGKSCPIANSAGEYIFREGSQCSHRLRVIEDGHSDPIANVALHLTYAKRIPNQSAAINKRGGGDSCGGFYDECYSSMNYPLAGTTNTSGEITATVNASHNYYANIYISDTRFRVTETSHGFCTETDRPGHYVIDYSDGDPYYEPDNNAVLCSELP